MQETNKQNHGKEVVKEIFLQGADRFYEKMKTYKNATGAEVQGAAADERLSEMLEVQNVFQMYLALARQGTARLEIPNERYDARTMFDYDMDIGRLQEQGAKRTGRRTSLETDISDSLTQVSGKLREAMTVEPSTPFDPQQVRDLKVCLEAADSLVRPVEVSAGADAARTMYDSARKTYSTSMFDLAEKGIAFLRSDTAAVRPEFADGLEVAGVGYIGHSAGRQFRQMLDDAGYNCNASDLIGYCVREAMA
ncbi:MAG: hypothetical protein ABIA93_00290 [Candidatus Woesearchaeota archaeon]